MISCFQRQAITPTRFYGMGFLQANYCKMHTQFDITADVIEKDDRHPKEIWEDDYEKNGYKYDPSMEQILFIVDHPVFLSEGDTVFIPNHGYCIVTYVLYDAVNDFLEYHLKLS